MKAPALEVEIKNYWDRLAKMDFRTCLEPIRLMAKRLGNPQDPYPSIHIAGTNGKGSTAAFLEALLRAEGKRVGLITSPHLFNIRERMQVNREWISVSDFEDICETIRGKLPEPEFLSYFEMTTLIGFEFFARKGVDAAIVETGMGGRLDATNILKPMLAVLTPISLDHQKYLGNTLEKIAAEKCGILKPGMKVITAPQRPDVLKVIEGHCRQLSLPLKIAQPTSWELSLAGEHQKINAGVALLAAETFLERKMNREALKNTRWEGRLEILQQNPTILVDAAHNGAGIETLAQYLRDHHPHQKMHFLVGVLKEKAWKTMWTPLLPLATRFHCVTPMGNRVLPATDLATALNTFGKPTEALSGSVAAALQTLLPTLKSGEMLVATGSIYVVGEILSCIRRHGTDGYEKHPN